MLLQCAQQPSARVSHASSTCTTTERSETTQDAYQRNQVGCGRGSPNVSESAEHTNTQVCTEAAVLATEVVQSQLSRHELAIQS
jgi:hypothetical protein